MEAYQRIAHPYATGCTEMQPREWSTVSHEVQDAIREGKPVAFFFPGIQTIDGADTFPDQTARDSLDFKSSVLEKHLGDSKLYHQGLRFFTLTYSRDVFYYNFELRRRLQNASGRAGDAQQFLREPDYHYSQDAKDFARHTLVPLLKTEDSTLEEPTFLPPQVMKQRLKLITFFADSYGSIFAEQVGHFLQREMRKDYQRRHATKDSLPDEEARIRDVLSSLVVVAASNIPERHERKVKGQAEVVKNCFTGVYFEGRGDKMIDLAQGYSAKKLLERAPTVWRTARSLFHKATAQQWQDSFHFSRLSPEQFAKRAAEEAAPYQPDTRDRRITWHPVDKGAVVHFDVPTQYDVVLRTGTGARGRHYANEDLHQTYSYTYPFPGFRDHADLLGRVARNAVWRHQTLANNPAPVSAKWLMHQQSSPLRWHPLAGQNDVLREAHLNTLVAKARRTPEEANEIEVAEPMAVHPPSPPPLANATKAPEESIIFRRELLGLPREALHTHRVREATTASSSNASRAR